MSKIRETTRRRLEMQGFGGLPDSMLRRIDTEIRVGPAVCSAWLLLGLLLAEAPMVGVLVPVYVLGAALRRDPIDLVREGLRRDADELGMPPNPGPRRFAALAVAGLLTITAGLLLGGYDLAAWLVGGSTLAVLLLHVLTGYCLAARLYARIFGPPTGYRL